MPLTIYSTVVGTRFRPSSAQAAFQALEGGEPLLLEREPENPHDFRAIKVLIADKEGDEAFIGYIPRSDNKPIQQYLDKGEEYEATYDGMASVSITFPGLEEEHEELDFESEEGDVGDD